VVSVTDPYGRRIISIRFEIRTGDFLNTKEQRHSLNVLDLSLSDVVLLGQIRIVLPLNTFLG
jgi:hypothetical protein